MNELWFDKIAAYLDGKLTPKERSEFESELSVNEELASAVRIYRTIETEMRSEQEDKASEVSLKQTLEEVGSRYFRDETAGTSKVISGRSGLVKKIPSRIILGVAAAVLVILALGGVLYYITGNNRTEMVAGKNHPGTEKRNKDSGTWVKSPDKPSKRQEIPAKIPITDRFGPSREELEEIYASNFKLDKAPEDKGDLEDELTSFEKGHHKEAILGLEDAKTYRGRGDELETFYNYYYLGLCYMAIEHVEKAIPNLETALKESPEEFKSKTKWYLALAYLKKGELGKAEKFLNIIARNKQASGYKSRAIKLLENLAKYR